MEKTMGTAAVTGASSGIGAVYAERLASRGYDLLLIARRIERLEALAGQLKRKYGVSAETICADLSNRSDLELVANRLHDDQTITLLVNNAGVSFSFPSGRLGAERAQKIIDLNISALVRLSLAVFPRFLEQNSGTLINLSSVLSLFPVAPLSTYCGTKAFVNIFTQGLQKEAKNTDVRIQAVLPASVHTEIWEVSGFGGIRRLDPKTVMTAEDCVDAALAGLDAGESVTLPSLDRISLWQDLERAVSALPAEVNTGEVARRYKR